MSETSEKLKEVQTRVKTLAGNRDQIIREAGAEENKLKEAHSKLKELGVPDSETMSAKELQTLADDLRQQLADKLLSIEQELVKGEALMAKYKELKETNG